MNSIFVFDNSIAPEQIPYSAWKKGDRVYLLPLVSNSDALKRIRFSLSQRNIENHALNSAELVNDAAEKIRDEYIRLIAQLPERVQIKGKNLRQWFAVDSTLSLWWMSLISEKNTLKSQSFNRLTQMEMIVEAINQGKVEKCILGCHDQRLINALRQFADEKAMQFELIPTQRKKRFKALIQDYQGLFFMRHFGFLINFFARFWLRTWMIKWFMGRLRRKMPAGDSPVLITNYPNLDTVLAGEGKFRNNFYAPLQETLEQDGKKITWVAMYVDNESISLRRALKYTKSFIENGHEIHFLEEFNSASRQIKAFFAMLRMGFKFLAAEGEIKRSMTLNGYNIYALFKDDWYRSFVGTAGYFNLLLYYMYQGMIASLKPKKCLYCCEMHAWEKALILANNSMGSPMSVLAYQHATVSRMLLNYFNDPSEMGRETSYRIPQPNKIICNGEVPFGYMKNSGWPEERLAIAEAIRYEHLKGHLDAASPKKDVILLAFSLNAEESGSLLNIAYDALSKESGIEVWIKPHPFLIMDDVYRNSDIVPGQTAFKIKGGPIEELLPHAKAVIAGQSGVSIEALAFGCDVITVDIPEQINMSPLRNIQSDLVWNVSSAEALRAQVRRLIGKDYSEAAHIMEARRIIGQYFYFNQNSSKPERLLELLESDHAE